MNEASKQILMGTVKEWTKFTTEREKMKAVVTEVAEAARKVVLEQLAFLKTQNIEVECDDANAMKIMGVPVHVDPVVDATFPNVKVSVVLKCGAATRTILVNPNMTISAGGTPITFDQFKKAIPDAFQTNAAEFLRDSYLYVARTGGKEEVK